MQAAFADKVRCSRPHLCCRSDLVLVEETKCSAEEAGKSLVQSIALVQCMLGSVKVGLCVSGSGTQVLYLWAMEEISLEMPSGGPVFPQQGPRITKLVE